MAEVRRLAKRLAAPLCFALVVLLVLEVGARYRYPLSAYKRQWLAELSGRSIEPQAIVLGSSRAVFNVDTRAFEQVVFNLGWRPPVHDFNCDSTKGACALRTILIQPWS